MQRQARHGVVAPRTDALSPDLEAWLLWAEVAQCECVRDIETGKTPISPGSGTCLCSCRNVPQVRRHAAAPTRKADDPRPLPIAP